jgi:hypothetical protein
MKRRIALRPLTNTFLEQFSEEYDVTKIDLLTDLIEWFRIAGDGQAAFIMFADAYGITRKEF